MPLIDMFQILPLLERLVRASENIAVDLHRLTVNTKHIALNTRAIANGQRVIIPEPEAEYVDSPLTLSK